MRRFVLLAALLCLTGSVAFAQDAVKVDPKHYKVEFENSQVRVLRIHYGAHEKSVMHHHPDSVVTFLTDTHVKFTLPDGTSTKHTVKAGESSVDSRWNSSAGKSGRHRDGRRSRRTEASSRRHEASAKTTCEIKFRIGNRPTITEVF